jgi:hypothetical protein
MEQITKYITIKIKDIYIHVARTYQNILRSSKGKLYSNITIRMQADLLQ